MGETHETASLHVTGVLAHLMRGAVAIARVDLVMRTARTTARTHERLLVPSGPTASRCRVGAAGLLPGSPPQRHGAEQDQAPLHHQLSRREGGSCRGARRLGAGERSVAAAAAAAAAGAASATAC